MGNFLVIGIVVISAVAVGIIFCKGIKKYMAENTH